MPKNITEKKDDGYKITDQIGESGIERACESELRGTPGELTITISKDGNRFTGNNEKAYSGQHGGIDY